MTTSIEEHATLVELVAWIDKYFANIGLPTDERSKIATGCFDVAIEHQAAMAVLHSSQFHGSMFALLRVLTESVVRGLWLLHCATDVEISNFKKGRIDKEFSELISEFETKIGNVNGTLSALKANAWKAMNGFTHSGFIQVTRRHGEGTVGANYPESEIKQALSVAGALGLVAAGELAGMCNRPELIELSRYRMREYTTPQSDPVNIAEGWGGAHGKQA